MSVQLMPAFSHAELDSVREQLRKRIQGKGCFSFTRNTLSAELVEELSTLVDAGLARYRADGLA